MDIETDLNRSALTPLDINAHEVGAPELAAVGIKLVEGLQGYTIPYYDILGNPIRHYRIKITSPETYKGYRQPANSSNFVYFPPKFQQALIRSEVDYLIITEGEKKAAAACKIDIPAVGLGGVDSWRNRMIILPPNTQFEPIYTGQGTRAKLPGGAAWPPQLAEHGTLAVGLSDVIEYIRTNHLCVFIVFDSDVNPRTVLNVQRAAACLGYELRARGIPLDLIRQVRLPHGGSKMGLDDFLVKHGVVKFNQLLDRNREQRTAFPRHPNPREHVDKQLQRPKLSRRDSYNLSLAMLTELDSRGRRIQDMFTGTYYYFDDDSHKLMPVNLLHRQDEPLHETPFGQFLYTEFNISTLDNKLLSWFASQFTGEPPIDKSITYKVLARPRELPSSIVYQISDSHYAIVTSDPKRPLEIVPNGTHGILFEQGHVEPLPIDPLREEFDRQLRRPLKPLWRFPLNELSFAKKDAGQMELALLLCYISPWFNKWRGTQLPIELVIGEAGSGKSSLYNLRQMILMGKSSLVNLTNDIRDWYAGVGNTGGLYVLDNVHFTSSGRDLRQRLSDELCRITTESNPHIEIRKLYTTSTVQKIPVTATFAITALEQPFFNEDLLQRSALFELEVVREFHDSQWVSRHLQQGGGRIGWVAHHLVVLHKFLHRAIVEKQWNSTYRAKHRLANYEQCLTIMADVLGQDSSHITEHLSSATVHVMSEYDWTLRGLTAFGVETKAKYPVDFQQKVFNTHDIASWSQQHEEFGKNPILINAWRLGHYMQSHKQAIARAACLMEGSKKYGRKGYIVIGEPTK